MQDAAGGAAVRVDARKCFYVVNPSGDLAHTQVPACCMVVRQAMLEGPLMMLA